MNSLGAATVTFYKYMMMSMAEQNWKRMLSYHCKDWHGLWTKYSPQGEVTESYRSHRNFKTNPEQTEMLQTNRYFYSSDNIVEKTWPSRYDANAPDGIQGNFHDGSVFWVFETGHAVSVFQSVKVSPDLEVTCAEILFVNERLRLSAIVVYNNGDLVRTATIREDLTGFPSQQWSTETKQVPERDFRGNWKETYTTTEPESSPQKVSDPEQSQFKWGWEGNTSFHYPDGISISCPKALGTNSPMKWVANWLVNDTKIQQIMIEFDEDGHFFSQRLNLYDWNQI